MTDTGKTAAGPLRLILRWLGSPAGRALIALLLVAALGVIFHADGAFFKLGTHRDALRQASVFGILACGMTLVIITGDHETGFLTGPALENSDPQDRLPLYWVDPIWTELINHGKGQMPGMHWQTGGHTNSLIPFYAKGAGSERFAAAADQDD